MRKSMRASIHASMRASIYDQQSTSSYVERLSSTSLHDVSQKMRSQGQLSSTFGSISLSLLDLGLHAAQAIWIQLNYEDEHAGFWWCIALSFIANFGAIVLFLLQNVNSVPEIGPPIPSELEKKRKERPDELALVLMGSVFVTDALSFFTTNSTETLSMRKLGAIAGCVEDLPTLVLQVGFVYRHGWHALVATSLCVTMVSLAVRGPARLFIALALSMNPSEHTEVPTAADVTEPPLTAALSRRLSLAGSLVVHCSLWLLQLLSVHALYANSSEQLQAESAFDFGFIVDEGAWRTMLYIWIASMSVNVTLALHFISRCASAKLRQKLREELALSGVALTLGTINPEWLCVLCENRSDVFALERRGVLPALLHMVTMVPALTATLGVGQLPPIMLLALIGLSAFTATIYTARSILVALTGELRRPSEPRERTPLDGRFAFHAAMALLTLASIGLVLFMMISYVISLRMLIPCLCLSAVFALHVIANLLGAISLLNHYAFTHAQISDESLVSTLVLLLSSIDLTYLSILAREPANVREVQLVAVLSSLGTFLMPTVLVQSVVIFMTHGDEIDAGDPSNLAAATLGFAIATGTVKLMRYLTLNASRMEDSRMQGLALGRFQHTLNVLGRTWRHNRQPTTREGQTSSSGSVQIQSGSAAAVPIWSGETRSNSKSLERWDEESAADGWEEEDDIEIGISDPDAIEEVMCYERAIYTVKTSGCKGVFLQLPLAPDQHYPYFFVPIEAVLPVPKPPRGTLKRAVVVRIAYRLESVGWLDRSTVEQLIYNDPDKAWKTLRALKLW